MSISPIPKAKSDASSVEVNPPKQDEKPKSSEKRSVQGNAHFQQLTQAGGTATGSPGGPGGYASASQPIFGAPVGKITQTGMNPTVDEVPALRGEKKPDVERRVETNEIATQTQGGTDIHNHMASGYAAQQVYKPTLTLAGNLREQAKFLDDAGIGPFVLMGIPTKVIGGKRREDEDKHRPDPMMILCCGNTGLPLGKTYYVPDDLRDGLRPMTLADYDELGKTAQYPDTGVDWELGFAMLELRQTDPELAARIWPSITGLVLSDENSIFQFIKLKKAFPGMFYIAGELTGMKEIVELQNAILQAMLDELFSGPPIDSLTGDELAARVKKFEESAIVKIFKYMGRAGVPTVFHCDSSNVRNCLLNNSPGGGEYFSAIELIFELCPDTMFIWAHLGGLGKFSIFGPDHEDKLRGMLERRKNFGLDTSWTVAARQYSPNPLIPKPGDPGAESYDMQEDIANREVHINKMAALMMDYPDRFYVGSDTLGSRSRDSILETYAILRNWGNDPVEKTEEEGGRSGKRAGLFDRLSSDVLDMIEYKNFEALMKKAKADGDYYERHVMDKDLEAFQAHIDSHPKRRVPNNWPAMPGNASSGANAATTAVATTTTKHVDESTPMPATTGSRLKRSAPGDQESTQAAIEGGEDMAKKRRVSAS